MPANMLAASLLIKGAVTEFSESASGGVGVAASC